jgi:hypothetical protein
LGFGYLGRREPKTNEKIVVQSMKTGANCGALVAARPERRTKVPNIDSRNCSVGFRV